MLISSSVPQNLWGEALLSACYILNRISIKDKNKTPYELWKDILQDLIIFVYGDV
jgi:hypothetical protein